MQGSGFGAWAGAACSFLGENARSWEALGEARPGQSSLSAGAVVPSQLRINAYSSANQPLNSRVIIWRCYRGGGSPLETGSTGG